MPCRSPSPAGGAIMSGRIAHASGLRDMQWPRPSAEQPRTRTPAHCAITTLRRRRGSRSSLRLHRLPERRRGVTIRIGHGRGRGRPHVEVLPVDELPAGLPGPARPAVPRDESGRFLRGHGTTALAREAGKARGQSLQLARLLGLTDVADDHPWAPYARLAREWRDDHMATPGGDVGGGEVGPARRRSSARQLQLAASRYLSDQALRWCGQDAA